MTKSTDQTPCQSDQCRAGTLAAPLRTLYPLRDGFCRDQARQYLLTYSPRGRQSFFGPLAPNISREGELMLKRRTEDVIQEHRETCRRMDAAVAQLRRLIEEGRHRNRLVRLGVNPVRSAEERNELHSTTH